MSKVKKKGEAGNLESVNKKKRVMNEFGKYIQHKKWHYNEILNVG